MGKCYSCQGINLWQKEGVCIIKAERLFIIYPAIAVHRNTEGLMAEPVPQHPAFFSARKDILA